MSFRKKVSTLKVPHHKNTAGMPSVRVSPPKEVLLPMNMHSGKAAVPVVSPGDSVRIGQLIAREDGNISSPVHATVSGTVKAIEPYGRTLAIRIESDGKMEKDPAIAPPEVHDLDSFLSALRASGIVGLGGAAFPLWAKLDAVRKNDIETMVINGAECEPYITSDHRTMLEKSDLIVKGVEYLKTYVHPKRFVIGIEDNKPDAIAEMKRVFADDPSVEVLSLECLYPQGAKQVLVYNATGKVAAEGQRLAALGVLIINITTLSKMAQYLTDGMPLVERCVTVDGSAVSQPKNIIVPIGTPASYLFEQAGGLKCAPGKVIIGGPMMGKAVDNIDSPVVKACSAVLAFDEKDAKALDPTACIRCGRCVSYCPIHLDPTSYAHAMELEDEDEKYKQLMDHKLKLCIECGCCSFVCPAHRPLMQINRDAKGFLRQYQNAKKEGVK